LPRNVLEKVFIKPGTTSVDTVVTALLALTISCLALSLVLLIDITYFLAAGVATLTKDRRTWRVGLKNRPSFRQKLLIGLKPGSNRNLFLFLASVN
jgi:hypothetical protein